MGRTTSRNLAKSNLIFGGIKAFQMFIALVKNKIVAYLLGPEGLGIQALLINTINTIHQISILGVPQSSVREIAMQKSEQDRIKVIKAINTLSISLGLVAGLICIVFSKQLSLLVFNNVEYSLYFIIISIALFFEAIANCEIAILQGLRESVKLAIASLIGAAATLLISIPLYYIGRIKAIPYVLALGYAISAIVYSIFRHHRIKSFSSFSIKQLKGPSIRILKLGGVLMISSCIMTILSLLLNIVISRLGSNSDVGYYQAAYNCTYSFLTILIAILASDFYPRISADISNKEIVSDIVKEQIKLYIIILFPIIAAIVSFPSFIIKLLYTDEFLNISFAVQIMGIALIFRIIWQIFSYVILAKGDKINFLLLDALCGNCIFFIGNIIGYYLHGIEGLAWSYLITSIIIMHILFLFVRFKYRNNIPYLFIASSILFALFSFFVIIIRSYFRPEIGLIVVSVFCFLTIVFSLYQLQKDINYISYIRKKFKKS